MGMLLIVMLGSSCEKDPYFGPENQPVYFKYHYVNRAWGVADEGWLIDGEGRMWGFDMPQDFRYPDSAGHLTRADLEHNLGQADTLMRTLKRKEFQKYSRMIGGAAEGHLGERRVRGADMGSSRLSCYAYDPSLDAYRHVLLIQMGDWEQKNLSAEADRLVKWLKEYGVAFLSD